MAKNTAENTVVNTAADTKFTLERLQKYSRQTFGVSSSTFAGATAALDKNTEYTVEEVKKAIDSWRKKEAK